MMLLFLAFYLGGLFATAVGLLSAVLAERAFINWKISALFFVAVAAWPVSVFAALYKAIKNR